jgi:hypothetical protein
MGLGIGTCVTLFAAANPWLFRPRGLWSLSAAGSGRTGAAALRPDYLDWEAGLLLQRMGGERIQLNLGTEGALRVPPRG